MKDNNDNIKHLLIHISNIQANTSKNEILIIENMFLSANATINRKETDISIGIPQVYKQLI